MVRLTRQLTDNLAVTLGIALPLFLMVGFFVAGRMTLARTDPPQYDLVFATNYDAQWTNQPWELVVEDGALVIGFDPPADSETRFLVQPSLYVWGHETMSATPVELDFENVVDGMVRGPTLSRLNRRRLLSDPESPDGYRLEYQPQSSGIGLMGDLFGFARSRSYYSLRKGNRRIALTRPEPFYQVQFLAWIDE